MPKRKKAAAAAAAAAAARSRHRPAMSQQDGTLTQIQVEEETLTQSQDQIQRPQPQEEENQQTEEDQIENKDSEDSEEAASTDQADIKENKEDEAGSIDLVNVKEIKDDEARTTVLVDNKENIEVEAAPTDHVQIRQNEEYEAAATAEANEGEAAAVAAAVAAEANEEDKEEEAAPEETDSEINKLEGEIGEGSAAPEVPQLDVTVPEIEPLRHQQKKKKNPIFLALSDLARSKLAVLKQNFKPIPFSPSKTLDFSPHEELFRALGLWDFVHLDLSDQIRPDLLILLIVNYNSLHYSSSVNGFDILLTRLDLAEALRLPLENKEGESNQDIFLKEESKGIIEEFVSNYILLEDDDEDDMVMLPAEVVAATQFVKEGQANKVDWAGLIWILLEKEILDAPKRRDCPYHFHYASHVQRLIKFQQPRLFEDLGEEAAPVPEPESVSESSVDVSDSMDEEDSEDGDDEYEVGMRSPVDFGNVSGSERLGPELSLRLGEENEDLMDGIGDCKGIDERNWADEGRDDEGFAHCLRRCNSNEVRGMEFENLCNGEEQIGRAEEFADLERFTSTDLLNSMDTARVSYSPQLNSLHHSGGEFLSAGSELNKHAMLDGGLGDSIFCENNGKRHIDNVDIVEDDIAQFNHNNQQKRMRTGGLWEEQAPSGFDSYMEQIQRTVGKARMLYIEKEQACLNAHLELQCLNDMLEEKDTMIQTLEKTRVEEQQKWCHSVARYERELNALANLVAGYKKALKETRDKFTEYRMKCPQGDLPLYRDVGEAGGLVLSSRELERQRLEKEAEMKQTAVEVCNQFVQYLHMKFQGCNERLTVMGEKLGVLEKEVKLMNESFAEFKGPIGVDTIDPKRIETDNDDAEIKVEEVTPANEPTVAIPSINSA